MGKTLGMHTREIEVVDILRPSVAALLVAGVLLSCDSSEKMQYSADAETFEAAATIETTPPTAGPEQGAPEDADSDATIGRRLDAAMARTLVDDANAWRSKAGLAAFDKHRVLDHYAGRVALAMAQAVLANPSNPTTPQEVADLRLDEALPQVAKVALQLAVTSDSTGIALHVSQWKFIGDGSFTHLGLAVAPFELNSMQRAWVTVGLAAKLVPDLSPELINQGRREFHLTCSLCGHHHLGRVGRPSAKNAGALVTRCPKCNRVFNVFGIDPSGDYHRPHRFMRGFKPKEEKDALRLWLYVLANCRYVKDVTQYGRDEVWQLAKDTYAKRCGDCEDTSILLVDWLKACGFQARAVLGREGRGGHAWVVLREGGKDYILETTGGRNNYRRTPPRASMQVDYFPEVQFETEGTWFRTSRTWTSAYFDEDQWARAPVSSDERL